jgi:hypothetical protein
VVATCHLNHAQPLEVGDRIQIAGHAGILRSVEPLLGEVEVRLVVQLLVDRGLGKPVLSGGPLARRRPSGGVSLECVRPWCDLVVARNTKSEEAQAVKALQMTTSRPPR